MRISSSSVAIDNINKRFVELAPNSTYTLGVWMRTEGVQAACGAQVYMWDEATDTLAASICGTGTQNWTHSTAVFRTRGALAAGSNRSASAHSAQRVSLSCHSSDCHSIKRLRRLPLT